MSITVKIPAIVENVTKHTDTVCSIVLQPQKKCPSFNPGQFLHLALDPYDPSCQWPESRVFSIANSPTRRDKIKITYAVKGRYTSRMYNEIKKDDLVWIKLPYGAFTFADKAENIVLIAGGTGITPFVSFLEYAIDKNIQSNICLYYGVKNENLLLHKEIIRECDHKINNFIHKIYVENINDAQYNYFHGMLNIEGIYKDTKDLDCIYYISGPPEMVKCFKEYLKRQDIKDEKIRIDEWE